jgi:Protein kinase domain
MREENSGRSRSSRDRRPRHHTQQQQQPSRQSGNNNAPSSSQQHYSSSSAAANQATTPMPYGKHNSLGNSTTPPESIQPSFPPPAVTSESPTPEQGSQRRPAYLLHRDLVIGKGSYGQVCIASRGEAEGHTSGRSGKRKKFACKCVMLRNDPKYIAKLQEEVNVLREVRGHDNVIRLYDVFCVDNELFIITELGRGGDLFHLLTTHPKHGVTESYAGTCSSNSTATS